MSKFNKILRNSTPVVTFSKIYGEQPNYYIDQLDIDEVKDQIKNSDNVVVHRLIFDNNQTTDL